MSSDCPSALGLIWAVVNRIKEQPPICHWDLLQVTEGRFLKGRSLALPSQGHQSFIIETLYQEAGSTLNMNKEAVKSSTTLVIKNFS